MQDIDQIIHGISYFSMKHPDILRAAEMDYYGIRTNDNYKPEKVEPEPQTKVRLSKAERRRRQKKEEEEE